MVIWVKVCFASVCWEGFLPAEEQWISCFVFTSVFVSGSAGFCFRRRAQATQVRPQSGPCRPAGDVTLALRVASAWMHLDALSGLLASLSTDGFSF